MSLTRLLLRRSIRCTATITSIPSPPSCSLIHHRTLAFSSAEEAAAERRRRKRRLRIEPPLHALRQQPTPRSPSSPRLPDTTSSLTGPRLNLHNRVQSLVRAFDLDSAAQLARHSVFSKTRPTVFTCNAIIAAMYRSGRYSDAVSLFHFFFNQSNIVPNIVSYNFLIVSHCESNNVDQAIEVYNSILSSAPFGPSSVTFRHLTKGLVDAGRISEAVDYLREMLNKGLGADSIVYDNLIKGFLDLGDFDRATEFFDELKERCLVYDGVVNATFMEWFFKLGRGKEAMESYRSLLDRQFKMTPATCNVLLQVLIRHGRKKEAWELFDSMLDNHTPPNFQAVNSESFNIMVNECFKEGKYEDAVATFRKVGTKAGSRQFAMDVAGYNNMILRFAEHGMIQKAEEFFTELKSKSLSPDVTGYRTLVDAYLKEQRIDDAMRMFELMVEANLRVIPEYANRWFSELIANNKAVECSQVLTKMGERDPKPDSASYEIVIKGLCGGGLIGPSVDMVGQVMRYGVGVPPSLREFLLEVFEKEGRREEMERLLDDRRQQVQWQGQGQGQGQQPHPQPSGGRGQFPRPTGSAGFGPHRPPSTGYAEPAGPIAGSSRPAAGPIAGLPGPAADPTTRFQGGSDPVGFAAAGQAGFTSSGRNWGFAAPGGNANSSSHSAFPGSTPGYQELTGPAEQIGGYSGPVEPARFHGAAGSAGTSGSTEFQGHLTYSGPNEPPQQRGYPEPGSQFFGRSR